MQDIRKGPPPDNGMEVMYGAASINDKALGYGEPIRVKAGDARSYFICSTRAPRTIFASRWPDMIFNVIALDGNSGPNPRAVRS